MGTITTRKRRDGTAAYTAQVRIMRGGKRHTEAQTFDRKKAAETWLKKRESELAEPGALDRLEQDDPTLADVIDTYTADSKREHGRTKTQVLRSIKKLGIAELRCSQISSADLVAFVKELGATPQTAGNYFSHLSSIFAVARPAWGYPLDQQAAADAKVVLRRLGLIGKSRQRERRPTLDELDKLLTHFGEIRSRRVDSNPMQAIVAYALFSTRRLEEITRQAVADINEARSEATVRDMKHPGEKIGNDVRTTLTPEALRIVRAMPPAADGRLFAASPDAISAAFTRACALLGIEDLHFHDLRHEGISRLFEMGWTIPQVATVSGHRSWQSLKRYSHLHQTGDKYAGWPWLDRICEAERKRPGTEAGPNRGGETSPRASSEKEPTGPPRP